MASRNTIQRSVESCFALLAFLIVPWLPRPLIVALSRSLGGLGYLLSARTRKIAVANLEAVYGGRLTRTAVDGIVRDVFQTMALVALDLFWFGVNSERRIRRYVRCDASADAFFQKGPKIAVAAHFGNWEILGQAFSLLYEPASSVAAPLRNPFVDRLVCHMRQATGQKVVPRTGAIRALIRLLREGGTIALLNDQNTLPVEGGVFVDFFGLPVPVSKAVAGLYVKERPDLAFVYGVADRKGYYTISARRLPEEYRTSDSIQKVSQAIMQLIETAIREDPGQWAWLYKRWKLIPEKRSFEGFPFYARPIEPCEAKAGR